MCGQELRRSLGPKAVHTELSNGDALKGVQQGEVSDGGWEGVTKANTRFPMLTLVSGWRMDRAGAEPETGRCVR